MDLNDQFDGMNSVLKKNSYSRIAAISRHVSERKTYPETHLYDNRMGSFACSKDSEENVGRCGLRMCQA